MPTVTVRPSDLPLPSAYLDDLQIDLLSNGDLLVTAYVNGAYPAADGFLAPKGDTEDRLFGLVLNADGTAKGEPFRIDKGFPRHHDVAVLKDGGFAVVYDDGAIYTKVFEDDGSVRKAQTEVFPVADDHDRQPHIIANPDGGFTIVGRSGTTFGRGDWAQRSFSKDGAALEPSEDLDAIPVYRTTGNAFLRLTDDMVRFVGADAMAYTPDDDGVGLSGNRRAASYLPLDGGEARTVIALADGRYAMAGADEGTNINFKLAVFTPNATGNTDTVEVVSIADENFDAPFGTLAPNLVALPDGGVVAYWRDQVQVFDADLNKIGSNITLRDDRMSFPQFRTATVNDDGVLVMTYSGGYLDANSNYVNSVSTASFTLTETGLQARGTAGGGTPTPNGGPGPDTLIGDAGPDDLFGAGGNDTLKGNGGADVLKGGAGRDRLEGGSGQDTLKGGGGADKLFGNGGNDRLESGGGADNLKGGGGDDRLLGGGGFDALFGGSGRDHLSGQAGADRISGQAGNDKLFGQGGADTLKGGGGRDVIDGGKGRDVLSGGAGADTFVFNAGDTGVPKAKRDVIVDFRPGDRIDLQRIDAHDRRTGNDDFEFSDSGPADHSVWTRKLKNGLLVLGDTDGDRQADFAIQLRVVTSLDADDFLF